MSQHSPLVFEFSTFRLDAEAFVLYHDNAIIRGAEKHSLEVLAVIISSPNQIATYDEIISRVWPDVEYGVDSSRVNQHISKLRGIFSSFEPDLEFFENLRGRGYRFTEPVARKFESEALNEQPSPTSKRLTDAETASLKAKKRGLRLRLVFAFAAISIVVVLSVGFWYGYSDSDTEKVAKVVKDSQMYESLVLYRNPERFQEADLDKYWTSEFDLSVNFDRTRIKQSVRKLLDEQRQYGDETKCEQFDFQSVEINRNGEQATARTFEKWMIAEYHTNGNLIKVKNVGPYFVDYLLRKIDGRWLIERSTTARTVRPTPRIQGVEKVSEPVAGREFAVSIAGSDFEPITVFVEVVGNGCPEIKPCKVDNGALLERSKLSPSRLENVPLTLASGEYKIFIRNGDSRPSNPASVIVP